MLIIFRMHDVVIVGELKATATMLSTEATCVVGGLVTSRVELFQLLIGVIVRREPSNFFILALLIFSL